MSEQEDKRSVFWTRLRENALTIVTRERDDLQKQTCPPEYCLLPGDKDLMGLRQHLIDQFNRDIERLKTDNWRSRALALVTICIMQPVYQIK